MDDYSDIIDLPHHISKTHPQMSMDARAAQFAPFAALTGYEDAVKETARQVDTMMDTEETIEDPEAPAFQVTGP